MEHFYQTIGEDWFSYADFYKEMVAKYDHARFAEIGCWKGRSTAYLGVEIINQKKDIEVHCIDSWKYRENTEQPVSSQKDFDYVFEQFSRNIIQFPFIKTFKIDSVEGSIIFPDNYFDFIFIDAGHHYVDVLQDIKSWYPKLKGFGIIAGHDYFTKVHPGVKSAVDEYFNYDVWCSPKKNIWIYQK